MLPTRKSVPRSSRQSDHAKNSVKRRRLLWYGHVFCSSILTKTILQDTVKGVRRQGRQRKRWEDNIREWIDGSREQGKMEKTGRKIICGAPTTLAVEGLAMMMMIVSVLSFIRRQVLLISRRSSGALILQPALPPRQNKQTKQGSQNGNWTLLRPQVAN